MGGDKAGGRVKDQAGKGGGLFKASAADNLDPSAISQTLAVLNVSEFLISTLSVSAVLFCVAVVA